MHANRFDALLRALPDVTSRRGVLRGLAVIVLTAVGLPGALDAKRKHRKKRKRKKTCKGDKKKCGKQCIPAVECCTSGDCGSDAQACLSNGSCAVACDPNGTGECPVNCGCTTSVTDATSSCVPVDVSCGEVPQMCTSTSECPHGQHCQLTSCGPLGEPENRCVPLCIA